ncbi:MAG TPA: TIR domain-containing protein, partial [Longimicrobium sp.]
MPSPVAVPAADRPARAVSRVGTAMEGARRFLFGHDVFIPYARADALEYAQALADALTRHRLSTYVDQLGTPPGPVIPPLLLLRLRLSGMLVLVGSPGAAASQAVAQEVETFVQRSHRLFVVDVEGALDGTAWYRDRIRGGPARRVTRAELAGGVPSEPVVEQILKNVDFARREDRLRRTMRYTLGGIGTMLVLGAAGALVLNARAADLGRQAAAASAAVDSLGHVGAALTLAQRADAAADGSADGWVRSLLLSAESLREAWTVDGAGAWLRGMSVLSPSLGAVRSHGVPIQSLAVSGDGRRMATGGADGRLRIWDVAESGGRVSATPRGNALAVAGRGPVTALAFSADGRMLASGFGEWLVVWGVDGPRAVPRLLRPMRGTVHGLAFTPDGRTLAVGETYHARLVETGGWRDTLLPETPQRAGIGVAFSPDGRWLAVGGGGETELWDVASRTLLGVARVGGRQLGFAGGGTALVADGAWVPIAGGPAAPTLGTPGAPAVEGGAQPLAASRDGRFVARASSIGGTGLVDAAGRDLARMPVEPASTLAWRVVAFGP